MNLYKQIKSLIPVGFKYPFWFVFKSPQRKLSVSTVFTDLQGLVIFAWYHLFPRQRLQPVSVCTGLANRSENYLGYVIESLLKAKHKELITLSVFDCASTDVANLEQAIREKWDGPLVFQSERIPFTRSYTFNKAVIQAPSPIVFVCDADMSLPADLVILCNQYTARKRVWYPIYFFLFKNKPAIADPANGTWEPHGGKGVFAALREDYLAIGGLNEQYKEWGHEDTELWERFHKAGYTVIRNRQKDFFHHWHNSFNPKYKHMNDE